MRYSATHSIECAAPARDVFGMVADVAAWPTLLGICEAVRVLEVDGDSRLIAITAVVDGTPATWRSRRTVDTDLFAIDADILDPMPLVAAMSTSWRVVALDEHRCVLLLEHFYDLDDDVRGLVAGVHDEATAHSHVDGLLDVTAARELAAYQLVSERRAVETKARGRQHLRVSRECAVPAELLYASIRDPRLWPELFEACTGAWIVSDDANGEVSRVEATQDGRLVSWDTRRTYHHDIRRIDYELLVPMPFVAAMQGQWRVVELGPDRSVLVVDRWWRVLDDVTGIRSGINDADQASAFVRAYVERNAVAELDALETYALSSAVDVVDRGAA